MRRSSDRPGRRAGPAHRAASMCRSPASQSGRAARTRRWCRRRSRRRRRTDCGTGHRGQARRRVVGGVRGQWRLHGRPGPVRLDPEERQRRGGARVGARPGAEDGRHARDRGPGGVAVGRRRVRARRHRRRAAVQPAVGAAAAAGDAARRPPRATTPRVSAPARATVAPPRACANLVVPRASTRGPASGVPRHASPPG